MKRLVPVLVLCLVSPLIRGDFPDCATTFLNPGQTSCVDEVDGSEHEIDSTWTNSQCYQCHCSSTGMTCCDTIIPPSNPSPATCTVEYDYQTCRANLVKRDDPTSPC